MNVAMTDSRDFKHGLLIFNPVAGTAGSADMWLGRIVQRLTLESNYIVTCRSTRKEPERLLDSLPSKPDLVIAAGGDGTVRQVLEEIAVSLPGTPVGIVPLGTGNQLARNLGIFEENILGDPLERAIDTILRGRPERIDLGKMNGRFFSIAAGAGPMSDAVIMPGHEDKASWKMLAYASSMIQTFALPPVVFNVSTGGNSFTVSASGIFVMNVGDLGMGKLSDTAQLNDGLLDLCILDPSEFQHYLELGFGFAGGFVGGKAPYYIRKVKEVEIAVSQSQGRLSEFQKLGGKMRAFFTGKVPKRHLSRDVTAMIDGDAFGTTPMRIEVVPSAVSIIVSPNAERQ